MSAAAASSSLSLSDTNNRPSSRARSPERRETRTIKHEEHQTQHKATARMLGSATAGAVELSIFHPVDTVAKRLMTHHGKLENINSVIFKQAADKSFGGKFASLFPGLGFAAGYKILQRTYKFGGQPFVNDYLNTNAGTWFKRTFGERNGKTMMQATAGSIIGVGEILLLPLDVMKIKAQTNPAAFGSNRGLGLLKLFITDFKSLYAGAGSTALRNAPGSFALFGGAEWTYQHMFHLSDRKQATFMQFFTASIIGSVASIVVAAPLDVIKTRVQSAGFHEKKSGLGVFNELMKKEGPGALFKGLTPKVLMVGPKLIFSFTVAQYLIARLEQIL